MKSMFLRFFFFFSEFPIFSNQQKLDSSKLFSFLSTAMLKILNISYLLLDQIEIFLCEILFLIRISTQTLVIGEFQDVSCVQAKIA